MMGTALSKTVRLVAILNLAYFGIEFAVAVWIGSVSLFADSIDFLEDASVNFLILVGLGWTIRNRARLGMALAGVLLIPALATLWTAWVKFSTPIPPEPTPLALTAVGAMLVNLFCALMLARYRHQGGSLTRAAFLSARNDVMANIAIVAAGLVTAFASQHGQTSSLALQSRRSMLTPRARFLPLRGTSTPKAEFQTEALPTVLTKRPQHLPMVAPQPQASPLCRPRLSGQTISAGQPALAELD